MSQYVLSQIELGSFLVKEMAFSTQPGLKRKSNSQSQDPRFISPCYLWISQWMPETMDCTEPYIYYVFFPIRTDLYQSVIYKLSTVK